MTHAASHAYPFMGTVSDHLAEFMPKGVWELPPSEDVDAYLLDKLLGDRATVAYAYAARSLDLLRSITALAGCALVDGTEILARSCIEHEAAAVIAAMGSDAVFERMLRSSFKWLSFHAELSKVAVQLPRAPAEWTDGGMGWTPKRLFTEAIAIAEAGDYSVERIREMRWFHGYLSYSEGHADLRLAVLRQVRSDGVALERGIGIRWVMNAAVEATAWAATSGACVVGAPMEALHEAVERFQNAVPIPSVPA